MTKRKIPQKNIIDRLKKYLHHEQACQGSFMLSDKKMSCWCGLTEILESATTTMNEDTLVSFIKALGSWIKPPSPDGRLCALAWVGWAAHREGFDQQDVLFIREAIEKALLKKEHEEVNHNEQ